MVRSEVEIVVYGLIIILVMIFMPKGLISVFDTKLNINFKAKRKKSIVSEKGV